MLDLSHKNLEVYKIAFKLLKEVYLLTKSFPRDEQYGLRSQIRRAAISVCCNLAEGASRVSKAEKRKFYRISRSSLVELDTQFEISLTLGYHQESQIKNMENYLTSVFRMLSKMITNLNPTSH